MIKSIAGCKRHLQVVGLPRRGRLCLLAVLSMMMLSCASVSSTPRIIVDAHKNWALLPFSNLSVTPRAEEQLAELVDTALRSRGVRSIDIYKPNRKVGYRSLFDDSAQVRVASNWARDRGQHYALTGTVHEWRYRVASDKEPTVGLTLQLLDVQSGQVLWQGNAARTSAGFTNLPGLAGKVVDSLLDQIQIISSNDL